MSYSCYLAFSFSLIKSNCSFGEDVRLFVHMCIFTCNGHVLFLPEQHFFFFCLSSENRALLFILETSPLYYCWAVNHMSPKPPSMSLSWTWAAPQTQTRTSAEDIKKKELFICWSFWLEGVGRFGAFSSHLCTTWGELAQEWGQHKEPPDMERQMSPDIRVSDQSLPN